LFWRAPRMTMASPGIVSCFTDRNFIVVVSRATEEWRPVG
jgi:hypothetical protein